MEEQFTHERTQLEEKCERLELQLEKQRIMVAAHKRDMDAARAELLKVRQDCAQKIEEVCNVRERAQADCAAKKGPIPSVKDIEETIGVSPQAL